MKNKKIKEILTLLNKIHTQYKENIKIVCQKVVKEMLRTYKDCDEENAPFVE